MGILGKGSGDIIGSPLRTAVNSFRVVTANAKKTSISRMASKSIFQYPVIASADIETNKIATMGKSLEEQLGAYVMAGISMNSTVDLDKYESVDNYLSMFHNNGDINPNVMAMITGATEATGQFSVQDKMQLALECWNDLYPNDVLDMGSLNDMYRPYERTKEKIEAAISTAMEAKGDMKANWDKAKNATANMGAGDLNKAYSNMVSRNRKSQVIGNGPLNDYKYTWVPKKDSKGNDIPGKGEYVYSGSYRKHDFRHGVKQPAIVKDTSLSTIAPTLINVSFSVNQKDKGNWEQNVVIGVKAMIRQVRSDVVVANMVEAVQSSNSIFNFIKYTDKEVKSALSLIGPAKVIRDARDMANANYAGDEKFMKMIQKRKMFNSAQKILGAPVPPTVTVIITASEVVLIKQITGVDLNNVAQVKKIMDKYYILAFGIFDNDLDELKLIFDGDSDWAVNTIHSLARLNSANKSTYMDMARQAEMIGRR